MSETVAKTDGSRHRAWLTALLGWAVPGFGHICQGRVWRGLVLGGTILVMFVVGLMLGGHLFGMSNSSSGLLSYIFGFCNIGAGLIYVLCLTTDVGVVEQAQRATSEYGNVFLMVAGLLNYLTVLDAYDIGTGRKS